MGFFRKPQSCSSESKKSQHGDEPEPQNIQPDATHDPKLQYALFVLLLKWKVTLIITSKFN